MGVIDQAARRDRTARVAALRAAAERGEMRSVEGVQAGAGTRGHAGAKKISSVKSEDLTELSAGSD
jgi:hypothetical protein